MGSGVERAAGERVVAVVFLAVLVDVIVGHPVVDDGFGVRDKEWRALRVLSDNGDVGELVSADVDDGERGGGQDGFAHVEHGVIAEGESVAAAVVELC